VEDVELHGQVQVHDAYCSKEAASLDLARILFGSSLGVPFHGHVLREAAAQAKALAAAFAPRLARASQASLVQDVVVVGTVRVLARA